MREILFRGKRSDSKGWIEGLPTYLTEYAKDMNEIDGIQCNRTRFNYDIHFETAGQFAGLTDRNGTKIFEGDIIKYKDNGCVIDKGNVLFKDGCFFVEGIHECYRLNNLDEGTTIEVIGTIYDNKDLIK